jgi:CO/xanthine dehydrogenase FAD-binding subunit
MKPAPFAYLRPASIEEAVELLADGNAKVLAGGQSLVPILSMRLASPATLVDINFIDGLAAVEVSDTAVTIGALTRHRALELHDGAFAANPLLRRALLTVAHPTIRNRGTTVGSLVHADPAAEMPAVLSLLGGEVEVVSAAHGRRTISAADFVVGPLESSVRSDELAVSATFPHPEEGTGSAWLELSRRQGDYAMVGVGALVTLAGDGIVTAASLSLIGVGLAAVRIDVGPALVGQPVGSLDLSGATDLVDHAIEPADDVHATAEYRGQLARVLSRRALAQAALDALERTAA